MYQPADRLSPRPDTGAASMKRTATFLTLCALVSWTGASGPEDPCRGPTRTDLPTELQGSRLLVLTAYREHRQAGALRVLALVHRDHPAAVECVFCCSDGGGGRRRRAAGRLQAHSVHYGYPYGAADILCDEPADCHAARVALVVPCGAPRPDAPICHAAHAFTPAVLTVRNQERREDRFPAFLTICMATVSGNHSNVLQFLQTMELYRLWGVQKVVLYLSSCSGTFQEVLDHYSQEGFLEVVPWKLGPQVEIHENGQLSVMNECVYRNMFTSRYVLLADVEQLLVPYQHRSLRAMLEELQAGHPQASVFRVETHLFPSTGTRPKGSQAVPGRDLLEHVYRKRIGEHDFRSHKMVVNPRLVVQMAMFEVLKNYGETVDVPSSMGRVMQVQPGQENQEEDGRDLVLDTRLGEFKDVLQAKVNEVVEQKLKKAQHGLSTVSYW